MRPTKGLMIGIVASILVGALLGASQLRVDGWSASDGFVVPVGRIGDQMEYAILSEPVGIDSSLEGPEVRGLRVVGTIQALDTFARTHAGVVVDWAGPGSDAPVTRTFVDVDQRNTFKMEVEGEGERGEGRVYTAFGPLFDDARLSDEGVRTGEHDNSLFWFQGLALERGKRLPAALERAFAYEVGIAHVPHVLSDWDSRVVGAGRVGAQDAWLVRLEGSISRDGDGDGPAPRMLPGTWDEDGSYRIVRDFWLSPNSAYPLVVETRVRAPGGDVEQATWVQIAAAPGSGSIPWVRSDQDPYARTADPPERSPEARTHPMDGQAGAACYPLAQALDEMDADPTRQRWRAWKESHPDHSMVTAQLNCLESGWTPLWWVIFAAPNGDAISMTQAQRVESQVSPLRPLFDEAEFESLFAPYDPADLPRGLLTWSEAVRLWHAAAPAELRGDDASLLQWGAHALGTGRAPVPDLTRLMRVFYTESEPQANGDVMYREAELIIDAVEGRIFGGNHELRFRATVEGDVRRETERWLGALGDEHDDQAASMVPARYEAPALPLRVGLTSTSILVIFLAAYFLPVIKYWATKHAAALAGFSKIRRSDLMKHRTRRNLLDLIQQEPGVTPPELARRLETPWSTIVYHLSVLEKHDKISSMVDGRHKRLFPGNVDRGSRAKLGALRNDRTRRMYEILTEEPGMVRAQLARRMRFTIPAALWHLERLEKAGLVARDREGRRIRYYVKGEPAQDG